MSLNSPRRAYGSTSTKKITKLGNDFNVTEQLIQYSNTGGAKKVVNEELLR